MSDRFGLGPLLRGSIGGIRRRTDVGEERRDWFALAVLFGCPILAGGLFGLSGWVISRPEALLAGVALLAGALVAVFAQLAAWRSKLASRNRLSEGVWRRALDEAVAHSLVAAALSMLLAILLAVLSNVVPSDRGGSLEGAALVVSRVVGSVAVSLGVLVALLFLTITNLLWDTYDRVKDLGDDAQGSDSGRRTGTSG